MNDFYKQGEVFQKQMMDFWTENMNKVMNMTKVEDNPFGGMFENQKDPSKFTDFWMDSFKKYQSMNGFDNFNFNFDYNNQQELLKKMMNGASLYTEIFEFWKDIQSGGPYSTTDKMTDLVKKCQKKNMEIINTTFLPMLPKEIAVYAKKPMEFADEAFKANENFLKPWIEGQEEFQDMFKRFAEGDKDVYKDFYRAINEKYNASYGKLFKMEMLGLNGEMYEEQLQTYDSYINMIISLNELMGLIWKVTQENSEKLAQNVKTLYNEGKAPQDFKEFYNIWLNTNEDAFESVFNTMEFSKLFGQFSAKYCEFKIKSDKLLEAQLKVFPLPSKTDMDDLYKTVYEQKKEIRSLKKDIKEIKEMIKTMSAGNK